MIQYEIHVVRWSADSYYESCHKKKDAVVKARTVYDDNTARGEVIVIQILGCKLFGFHITASRQVFSTLNEKKENA
ncbi:hypothetical protein LCGC14_0915420 [marine sediment metagenome]|uniref:Uncharacterized protein n=1 Tax=marine sediment metagenome TaxID=412755 RepID=A0A0F9RZ50_9ZZZZ